MKEEASQHHRCKVNGDWPWCRECKTRRRGSASEGPTQMGNATSEAGRATNSAATLMARVGVAQRASGPVRRQRLRPVDRLPRWRALRRRRAARWSADIRLRNVDGWRTLRRKARSAADLAPERAAVIP